MDPMIIFDTGIPEANVTRKLTNTNFGKNVSTVSVNSCTNFLSSKAFKYGNGDEVGGAGNVYGMTHAVTTVTTIHMGSEDEDCRFTKKDIDFIGRMAVVLTQLQCPLMVEKAKENDKPVPNIQVKKMGHGCENDKVAKEMATKFKKLVNEGVDNQEAMGVISELAYKFILFGTMMVVKEGRESWDNNDLNWCIVDLFNKVCLFEIR